MATKRDPLTLIFAVRVPAGQHGRFRDHLDALVDAHEGEWLLSQISPPSLRLSRAMQAFADAVVRDSPAAPGGSSMERNPHE